VSGRWRSPEELAEIGFGRSRVVMANEAHDGMRRSIETRRIGLRLLPAAHDAGVRHLAMEALTPSFAERANGTRSLPDGGGYLGQPDLRELMTAALTRGWTLVPYEANLDARDPRLDPRAWDATNWREDEQARKLVAALPDGPLLVWCGNGHLTKCEVGEWRPMGLRFRELSGIEPFALDQTKSVAFGDRPPLAAPFLAEHEGELAARGGVTGFLAEDAPPGWPASSSADAFVLALGASLAA
jgi:hypothetical protein